MNVIRHDYITPNGAVGFTLGTLGISDKCGVDLIACEICLPRVGAKGDKIKRARVKETAEPWRAASKILLHAKPVATALRAVQQLQVIPAFIDRPQAGGYSIRESDLDL